MKKGKSYLITGGAGLIGSSLANSLKGKVKIVTRSKRHIHRLARKDLKIIIKPIEKLSKKDIEGTDVIYHCASTVDNYNILSDPYIDVKTNINGTIHILELIKRLKKKPKLIYLSTFFVYGHEYDRTRKAITEDSKTDPLSLYPATKLCTESVIKTYSRVYGVPYLICRLTNVYGDKEDFDNKKKGALNYLTMQALKGNDLKIYAGGNFVRDYIYVDDVVSALLSVEDLVNDTYLIGYGKSIRFSRLIEIIKKETSSKSKIIAVEIPLFHKAVGINNMSVNTAKIRSLGWKPKINHTEGIRKIVARYRKLFA